MNKLAFRASVLAALGMAAMTFPSVAVPISSAGGPEVKVAPAASIQFAQLNPRQINEARGGDYAKKKKNKKKAKR
jgi:hypothetical protein